ncbi:hypothetical protein [Salmonirosea aquatica]|uniref:Uncharacterized protein n=1 Tax=Salmonirosea aquatica TaxID=2654236 RepID=A0A7C9BLH2_9BACT|nr:hypothetical protein [Cytophagaceae bacterium SJW1-29]
MKVLFNLFITALIISTFSCRNEGSLPEPEEKVDYRLVDSLLSAKGRYWVVEQITKIESKEKLEYISADGAKTSSLLGVLWSGGYITNVAFQFGKNTILQKEGGGVFGQVPYTDTGTFHIYNMKNYPGGSWDWSGDYTKINVNQLPEMLRSVLSHISKVDPADFEGYLDPASYPVYGNVEEIRTAGKSERIKIVMDNKDDIKPESFIFTLRAVWLDSYGSGGSRVSVYDKVIY